MFFYQLLKKLNLVSPHFLYFQIVERLFPCKQFVPIIGVFLFCSESLMFSTGSVIHKGTIEDGGILHLHNLQLDPTFSFSHTTDLTFIVILESVHLETYD